MKPLLLKIKGLNSFTDEQTIDFEKLSAKGLFGIFGPTGSGKSSIIDAITMALYGEISRYDGERKNRHFINALSETMWVFFQFSVDENGKEMVYVAERSYKRSKDTQKVILARLYRIEGDDIHIICDKPANLTDEVEKLICLNYKDFSRSVVLPQGKFNQFLLLANKDRRDMLERIFGLEKYGDMITGKIKTAYAKGLKKREIIEKQLEIFDDISEESILKDKENLTELLDNLEKKGLHLQTLEKEYDSRRNILKLVQDLEENELVLKTLLEKKGMADADKRKESNGSKALLILPVFNEYTDTEIKYKSILIDEEKTKPKYIGADKELAEAKALHTKAVDEKNSRLPALIDREVNLKRAIEIQSLWEALAPEVKTLREQYRNIKKELSVTQEKQSLLQEEKEKIKISIIEIRKKIDENTVTPEFRNDIDSGYMASIQFKEAEKNYQELKQISSEYETKAAEYTEKYRDISLKINSYENTLKQNEAELSALKSLPPTTVEIITTQKEDIIQLHNLLENTKEKYSVYETLTVQEGAFTEKTKDLNQFISEKEKKLHSLNHSLLHLKEQLSELERSHMVQIVAKNLIADKPCPVCGSLHHPSPAQILPKGDTTEIKASILRQENKIREEEKELSKAQLELTYIKDALLETQKEISHTDNRLKTFDALAAFEEINKAKEILKATEESYQQWDEKIKSLETMKQNVYETLNAMKLSENKLYETIKRYSDLKTHTDKEKAKSEETIKHLSEIMEVLKSKLGEIDFEYIRNNITEKDKAVVKLAKKQAILENRQNTLSIELDQLNNDIHSMTGNMERIKTLGSEKAALLQNYSDEIKSLAGENQPKLLLASVQQEIKNINESEVKLKSEQDTAEIKFDKISQLYYSVLENKKIYENLINRQKENYDAVLEKYGISNEEFKSSLISEKELYLLREKIKQYENTLNAKQSSIEGLKAGLKGRDTENIGEKTELTLNELNLLKDTIGKLTGDIAVAKENIIKKEEHLIKVRRLNSEKNELQNILDILEDLVKLFEGKKFVEYAARRQLEYITRDASKRLKEISGMRYALELDGTDFIIRDDFNGGIRRSPKTLSGGETFMASLCLALALSAKIQLKSRTSLEFFFLDEGFGSLDSDLLNTVMDSLIKLRMENIKVGIISHVEDLKNQIPVKLSVRPPGQPDTGTTVYID